MQNTWEIQLPKEVPFGNNIANSDIEGIDQVKHDHRSISCGIILKKKKAASWEGGMNQTQPGTPATLMVALTAFTLCAAEGISCK